MENILNYKLKKGDCLELMKEIESDTIDMTPYNPQGLIKLDTPKTIVRKKPTRETIYDGKDVLCKEYLQKYTNYPNNILSFSKESKCVHPTQKPVQLLEYLIKTYTDEGMLVLDNCMGSGSTGVACGNLNRRFIGIELEDKYFKISKERIIQAYKEEAKVR